MVLYLDDLANPKIGLNLVPNCLSSGKVGGNYIKKRQMSERKNRKLKKEIKAEDVEFDSDENFALIVGYTSGGAPYGLTHEEMNEIEKENNETDDII